MWQRSVEQMEFHGFSAASMHADYMKTQAHGVREGRGRFVRSESIEERGGIVGTLIRIVKY